MAAENKTQQTRASVAAFIAAIDDPARSADAKKLSKLMQEASGEKPALWGPSIVGFGSQHYRYDSGREGDTPLVAFSPRKAALVLYGVAGHDGAAERLSKLGKYATGKGCLYIKKLAEVDEKVLRELITSALAAKRRA